jgi:hypothetical protein
MPQHYFFAPFKQARIPVTKQCRQMSNGLSGEQVLMAVAVGICYAIGEHG